MDHHCPWTINCVSHRTFPHFFRFLFYAVLSTTYLEYLLYIRAALVWNGRNLPSVRFRKRTRWQRYYWLVSSVPWSFGHSNGSTFRSHHNKLDHLVWAFHSALAEYLVPGRQRHSYRKLGDCKTWDFDSTRSRLRRLPWWTRRNQSENHKAGISVRHWRFPEHVPRYG